MNILDFASNTEEEEVLKTNPQSYQVIGEVVNSAVQGDGPAMNYQPNMNQGTVLQDVIGAEQSQLANEEQQVAQQASDVAQQEQAVQQEEGGVMSFLGGLAKGFSEVMTNPDVLTGLNSFSAAMRGDINSYNAYQNAYAERMENRAQQRAAAAQKQRDNEAANTRAMQEQLWKQYTPESVAEFQRTGDYGVLMENEATKMAREAHNTDVAYKGWQMANTEKQQNLEQGNKDRDYNLESEKFGYSQEKDVNESLNKGAQQQTENAQKDRSLDIQEKQADATLAANQKKADLEAKERQEKIDSNLRSSQRTLETVGSILSNDSLDRTFGFIGGHTPNLTTGSQSIISQMNQLKGQQFLEGIADMKGMGALSDAEGAKIAAASAALFDENGNINQKLSPEFVKTQLGIIQATTQDAIERYKAKGGSASPSSASQGSNTTGSKYKEGDVIQTKSGLKAVMRNGKFVPLN